MDDREISLVSVGIPTYNRPDGLRRILQQITQQTYKQIEIIVSDNCSESDEVRKVVEAFMENNTRIKYFRQDINRGALFNFQFVLQKAKGEYFMWASDDDEWDPLFIETCLKHIGNAGLVMQHNFKTKFRKKKYSDINECYPFSINKPVFENITNFISNVQPYLFYGLYKRETISPILNMKMFDGMDIYILLRHILLFGINTFPNIFFINGIDTDAYVHKPINKYYKYWPLICASSTEILKCRKLTLKQRLIALKCFWVQRLWSFSIYEKTNRPKQAIMAKVLLKTIIYTNNVICKIARTTNYSIKK